MYSHAAIIPLIGGMVLAHEKVLGSKPKWIISYSPFQRNETHLLEYYKNSIPYSFIDKSTDRFENVDIISTVCPCAGLSSLSTTSSPNSKMNDWMYKSSEYILENYSPQVFWGENAPTLATNKGFPVLKNLHKIGKKNGYTLSLYRTASKLHGSPQIRTRSFYFFWKGNKAPTLGWFSKPQRKFIDVLNSIPKDATQQDIMVNHRIPSKEPLYQAILNFSNKTHQEFIKSLSKFTAPVGYLQKNDLIDKAIEFVNAKLVEYPEEKNYKNAIKGLNRAKLKFSQGLSIMDIGLYFPGEYIGAFVGGLPTGLVHPDRDRFLNVRECLTLMDLPFDFELQEPIIKNLNHICQNVPMNTAKDMVSEIVESLNGNREFVDVKPNSVYVQNNNNLRNYFTETEEVEEKSLICSL